MARAWNPESPVMKALTRVFDLMLVNVLFILTSLPVVTIGASLTAMHYVLLHIARNEEGYIVRSYFRAFRMNFRQSTIVWICMLLVGGVLVMDYRILDRLPEHSRQVASILLIIVAIVYICTLIYLYPFLARFENTIFELFKNTLVVSLVFFIRTVAMIIILAGFAFFYYNLPLRATPILLLFGFSFPGIIVAYIYTPILKRMEQMGEEEDEGDD